jgi:cysteine desulfuration protein SufE
MPTTPAPLPPALTRIVQRFQRLSDPMQRYQQLLWYAKRLKEFSETDKVPENRVTGCVSQVYVTAALDEGKVWFHGDSDSLLVRGLVGLLVEGFSGLTPAEILQVSPDFIQETGLNVSLTPSRANGFYNIFQMMRRKVIQWA